MSVGLRAPFVRGDSIGHAFFGVLQVHLMGVIQSLVAALEACKEDPAMLHYGLRTLLLLALEEENQVALCDFFTKSDMGIRAWGFVVVI